MSPVCGTYAITIQTPLGEKYATLILRANGTVLTGELITKQDRTSLSGSVTDNTVDFETMINNTPLGSLTTRIRGQVNHDLFTAEAKIMFGKLYITGSRNPE